MEVADPFAALGVGEVVVGPIVHELMARLSSHASRVAMIASLCGHQNFMSCQYSVGDSPRQSVKSRRLSKDPLTADHSAKEMGAPLGFISNQVKHVFD